MRYTDEFVILSEEEAVLQGMVDRVIEVGRCCGMEVNVENTKGDYQTIDYDATKQPENVEYFNYLCSMTTNGARCRCETKSRTIIGLMNCRTQLYGD